MDSPPTFGMYRFDADINDARTIDVPRLEDFSIDVAGVEAAVAAHNPKIVFLTSPNNPDGSMLKVLFPAASPCLSLGVRPGNPNQLCPLRAWLGLRSKRAPPVSDVSALCAGGGCWASSSKLSSPGPKNTALS